MLRMKTVMVHGFLDEAGDVGNAPASSRCLIVALVLTRNPVWLRKTVTKTRKHLGKKQRDIPEFKASKTDPKIVYKLLGLVAETGCEIVIVVADKRDWERPTDPEDLYRHLCALAVRRCMERHPRLSLTVDKRYTRASLREAFKETIIGAISSLPNVFLAIENNTSEREKALQVADAVAWGLFQKYERGDESFYRLVQDNVIVEELLGKRKNWLTLEADSHRSRPKAG